MTSAASSTAGTNHAETWSARRCIGAAEPWASSTRRTIWASVLSAPTAVARTTRVPVRLSGGADDGVADGLVDRDALAGQHRLVDGGGALGDDAVDGQLLAGPDPDEVADDDLLERDVDLGRRRAARARSSGRAPTRARIEAAVRFLALSSSQRPISTSATTTSAVSK